MAHRPPTWQTPVGVGTFCVLTLLGACSTQGAGPGDGDNRPQESPPQHLIVICIDTLRADHLGSYGSEILTPHLDGLAAEGARFAMARAHIPLTGPSHASLFTSSLPSDHGCTVNSQKFPPQNHTLAEILSEQGWNTAGFVSLGVLSDSFGFAQGFDSYHATFKGRWWKDAAEMNTALEDWLKAREAAEHQFLFLHYSDPHSPYAPGDREYPRVGVRLGDKIIARVPADSRSHPVAVNMQAAQQDLELVLPEGYTRDQLGCWKARAQSPSVRVQFAENEPFTPSVRNTPGFLNLPRALRLIDRSAKVNRVQLQLTLRLQLHPELLTELYREEVAYVDRQIGQAIGALKEAGLWDNAVIVFTADHGEGLGQHDLVGHVDQLYDSVLHVPLVIVAPGQIEPGSVIQTHVGHIDVLPTLLDLLRVPTADRFRGRSLLPLIAHEANDAPRKTLGETHKPEAKTNQRSLVADGYKYIVHLADNSEELYDLAKDPEELHDIASIQPESLATMRALLREEFALEFGPGVVGEAAELSEEQRDGLRGIGYAR